MAVNVPALQIGSGGLELIRQVALMAGSIVLLLMLVALGGMAYKHFQGDGIEWPDEEEADDGVTRSDDDEWKYY